MHEVQTSLLQVCLLLAVLHVVHQNLCSGLPLGAGVAGAVVSAVTLLTCSTHQAGKALWI